MSKTYRSFLYALPLSLALILSPINAKANPFLDTLRSFFPLQNKIEISTSQTTKPKNLQQSYLEKKENGVIHSKQELHNLKLKQSTYSLSNLSLYIKFLNNQRNKGYDFPNEMSLQELDSLADQELLKMIFEHYLEEKNYFKGRKQKIPAGPGAEFWTSDDKRIGKRLRDCDYVLGALSISDLKKPVYKLFPGLRIAKMTYLGRDLISPKQTLEQLLGKKIKEKTYNLTALNLKKYLNAIAKLRADDQTLPKPNPEMQRLVRHYFLSCVSKAKFGQQFNEIYIITYENGMALGVKTPEQNYQNMKILFSPNHDSESSLILKVIEEIDPKPFSEIPKKYQRAKKIVYGIISAKLIDWISKMK